MYTRFSQPSPVAVIDTEMEYAVFTHLTNEQCYDWVSYRSDPRMIPTDNRHRLISRMQRAGNDIVCYYYSWSGPCYGVWGSSEFTSKWGYPYQYLRVIDDCTVLWVSYTARDPIHPRAVSSGHMANGDVVYVTKFNDADGRNLAGHYVQGANVTVGGFGGSAMSSATMMMLIVVWLEVDCFTCNFNTQDEDKQGVT